MAGHAIDVKEASAPAKRSYRKLHHIEIEPVKGENGGHVVTHHYHSEGMEYHKPVTHLFNKEQGHEMLAHVGKHLGVKREEPEPEPEAAAGEPEEEPEGE